MSEIQYLIFAFTGCIVAGLLGSLTGLGGGIIVIPLLTLVFKVPLHYAMGASVISVIATSSGAAAAYVKEGITNIRLGLLLEIATTTGAVAGALVSMWLNANILAVIFGIVLLITVANMFLPHNTVTSVRPADPLAHRLSLNSTYPAGGNIVSYKVYNVIPGFLMMLVAGCMSGLLGIGSGVLKVLAMDNIMKLPFKVSTTTSNFMIGVTAAASAFIYFQRGQVLPVIVLPVALGVLIGALLGARILPHINVKTLRSLFAVVVLVTALQMIYKGIHHSF